MKNIILATFILTVLTILSCQNEKKEETNKQPEIVITKQKGTEFSAIEIKKKKTDQIVSKDSLDIIFIGKTTEELNKYNFHTCLGAILGNNSENEEYAVCIYSLHRNDCHKGRNKIVIEKFINYYEQGKANFVVKDELIVTSDFPKKCYSNVRMKLD
ncbi:hypothetical protein AAEO57_15395 [Flavobacterium sp. DGU38]|uniref:Lipoprotein n=1 Tax=Flavobacterium calami TaxID=3139144 RepID=A0ABU9IT49_9FLAO